ncbi:response regulator transcription factor [Rathayibacter soli]|uniref:response regulator transcription factor n=1 Tax=Rathayibacter soli TaxID=3144168 RepID=UPI0027E58BDC|nr:response regulator transcription factor [Glaciibacter superstes]
MIRIVIVDDQAMVRTGFRLILDEQPDLQVVGEAADGLEAIHLVDRQRPDVVLMDVRMPNLDGIEATRRILDVTAPVPRPKILLLTTFDLDEYVYSGLRAGASGFLLKDALAADLAAAIRTIYQGEAVTAPSVTRRLIEHYIATDTRDVSSKSPPEAQALQALTPREREVLSLVARGRSNAEIAADLSLSEGTVKTHIGRIFSKLGLRDRVQAVILGYRAGLVPPR